MNCQKESPLIFNLFPRHFRYMDQWSDIIPHVKEMAFNSVFVNPFHETGFSGSLYAVKDYYRLNPLFLRPGQDPSDFAPLNAFVKKCKEYELELIMDLVINHTAVDSELSKQHPQWYQWDNGRLKNPFAIDPGDASKVTVWGDLAMMDNEHSSDRDGLWKFWDKLIEYYQNMGIYGFRCDAAYQVPASLWGFLISAAKKRFPQSTFYAETLGCQLWQIEALNRVGFDYLFNSSKWWNFDQPWAIEQHSANKHIAPSIGFPESHDTERLASVNPGSMENQKSRYAFASIFSKGILMTMGYEYGATTRMDVVRGSPSDVDKPKWDISKWIKAVNNLKLRIPVLCEEGNWRTLSSYNMPFIFLEKSSDCGNQSVYLCINKRPSEETVVETWMIPPDIKRCSKTIQLMSESMQESSVPQAFSLDPSDIILFMQ